MNEIPPHTDEFSNVMKKDKRIVEIKKAAIICVAAFGALVLLWFGYGFWYERPIMVLREMTVSTADGETLTLIIDVEWRRFRNHPTVLSGTVVIGEHVYMANNQRGLIQSSRSARHALMESRWQQVSFFRVPFNGTSLSRISDFAFYNNEFDKLMIVSSAYGNRQFFGPASTAEEALAIRAALGEAGKIYVSRFTEEFQENIRQGRLHWDRIDAMFRRSGQVIYPDYIGGMYFNDDGHLVMQIVEDVLSIEQAKEVLFRNRDASDVVFEAVEFSYNELNHVMNELREMQFDDYNREKTTNMGAVNVEVRSNRVEVRLRIYGEEEIEWFRRNIMDSPLISFAEGMAVILF